MKEEAKCFAMQQKFKDHAAKFMDSKQRTIGVDKQSLDKQIEENKRKLEYEKQQDIEEGEHH